MVGGGVEAGETLADTVGHNDQLDGGDNVYRDQAGTGRASQSTTAGAVPAIPRNNGAAGI